MLCESEMLDHRRLQASEEDRQLSVVVVVRRLSTISNVIFFYATGPIGPTIYPQHSSAWGLIVFVFNEKSLFSLFAMAIQNFRRLKLVKIEKRHLMPNNCRCFDKTLIEKFLVKSCIIHIILAHCLCVLISMETITKKWKQKIIKNSPSETIYSMKLRPYRNINHLRLYRHFVFYKSRLFNLVSMATWSFHTLTMRKMKK